MLPSEAAPDQIFFVGGGGSGRQRSGSRSTPAVHRNKKLRLVAPVQHPTYTAKHDQNANTSPHVVLDYDDDSALPTGSGSGGGGPAGAGGGGGGTGQNKRTAKARKVEKTAVAVGGVDDLAAINDGDNDVSPPQSNPAQDHPTHIIIRVDDDCDSIHNVASEGGGGMATGDTGGGDAGRNKGVCIKDEEVAAVATVFSDSRPTQAPKAEDDVDDSADNVKNGGGSGGKAGIGGDGGDRGTNGYNMAFMPVNGGIVSERDGMILPCGADDLEFVPDLTTQDGPRYIMVDEYDDDSMGSIPSGTGGGGSVGIGTGGGGTGTNGPKSKATTNERMVIPISIMSVM